MLSVAGDWAFIPSEWKAIGGEDPALGIPTTYYAAVQLKGHAEIRDDPVTSRTFCADNWKFSSRRWRSPIRWWRRLRS